MYSINIGNGIPFEVNGQEYIGIVNEIFNNGMLRVKTSTPIKYRDYLSNEFYIDVTPNGKYRILSATVGEMINDDINTEPINYVFINTERIPNCCGACNKIYFDTTPKCKRLPKDESICLFGKCEHFKKSSLLK